MKMPRSEPHRTNSLALRHIIYVQIFVSCVYAYDDLCMPVRIGVCMYASLVCLCLAWAPGSGWVSAAQLPSGLTLLVFQASRGGFEKSLWLISAAKGFNHLESV